MSSNTTSASVRAGDFIYAFFNERGNSDIRITRFTEDTRDPKTVSMEVNGSTVLSRDGEIAVVYIEKNDELHLYYVGRDDNTGEWNMLTEAALKQPKSTSTDHKYWTLTNMDLNKKRFKAASGTYLAAALSADNDQYPRVFFRAKDNNDFVSMAEFSENRKGVKDWTVTTLTGVST